MSNEYIPPLGAELSEDVHDALSGTDKYGRKVENPVEIVKKFLEEDSENINKKFGSDLTLLHMAISGENIELIKFLLSQGADPNIDSFFTSYGNEGIKSVIFFANRIKENEIKSEVLSLLSTYLNDDEKVDMHIAGAAIEHDDGA